MEAFEMNPVATTTNAAPVEPKAPAKIEMPQVAETVAAPVYSANGGARLETIRPEFPVAVSNGNGTKFNSELKAGNEVKVNNFDTARLDAAPFNETKTFAAASAAGNGANGGGYKSEASANGYRTVESSHYRKDDGGFNVTVIEDGNGKQRNLLLLGSLLLMMTVGAGAMLYSLFNYNLSVAAIGDESGLSIPITGDTITEEIETPKPKEDKTAGGGGGGGGRQDQTPVSKGELPPQFKDKPLLTPSKEDISVTKPDIPVTRATQGPDNIIPKNRSLTNGDPNSTNNTPSNGYSLNNSGMGLNGKDGIGVDGENGYGRNGKGGRGASNGAKYGDDNGPGGRVANAPSTVPPPPPPVPKVPAPVGPSVGVTITSKPRANYTDAARQSQLQGTVTLRVTFNSNGTIGSIAPVSGLGMGLTEQAIAAARGIRFEPAKKNGVPQTVTKQVQYSFTIY